MRIVAVATLALVNFVTGGVALYKEEEDRVNKFVRQTGRIKRTVLTQTEEMMMREEIFLESLASKLSRKQNAITVDRSDWVPKMKSFLQTFTNRPRLQTKGKATTYFKLCLNTCQNVAPSQSKSKLTLAKGR